MPQPDTIRQESLIDLASAGSQRAAVRTWRSQDALAKYVRATTGINRFEVIGQ